MSDSRLDATWQPILASIAERVESIRSTMARDPIAAVEDAADLGVGLLATLLRGRDCDWMTDTHGEFSQYLNDVCRILSEAWKDAAVRRAFSTLQPQVVRLGDECGASWHEVAIHVVAGVWHDIASGVAEDDPDQQQQLVDAMFGGDWFPDAAAVAERWEEIGEHMQWITEADCEALQISLTKERKKRTADSKADSGKNIPKKERRQMASSNPKVNELARRINADTGARKWVDIARDMEGVDETEVQSLLRQLRPGRFRHLVNPDRWPRRRKADN